MDPWGALIHEAVAQLLRPKYNELVQSFENNEFSETDEKKTKPFQKFYQNFERN